LVPRRIRTEDPKPAHAGRHYKNKCVECQKYDLYYHYGLACHESHSDK